MNDSRLTNEMFRDWIVELRALSVADVAVVAMADQQPHPCGVGRSGGDDPCGERRSISRRVSDFTLLQPELRSWMGDGTLVRVEDHAALPYPHGRDDTEIADASDGEEELHETWHGQFGRD